MRHRSISLALKDRRNEIYLVSEKNSTERKTFFILYYFLRFDHILRLASVFVHHVTHSLTTNMRIIKLALRPSKPVFVITLQKMFKGLRLAMLFVRWDGNMNKKPNKKALGTRCLQEETVAVPKSPQSFAEINA